MGVGVKKVGASMSVFKSDLNKYFYYCDSLTEECKKNCSDNAPDGDFAFQDCDTYRNDITVKRYYDDTCPVCSGQDIFAPQRCCFNGVHTPAKVDCEVHCQYIAYKCDKSDWSCKSVEPKCKYAPPILCYEIVEFEPGCVVGEEHCYDSLSACKRACCEPVDCQWGDWPACNPKCGQEISRNKKVQEKCGGNCNPSDGIKNCPTDDKIAPTKLNIIGIKGIFSQPFDWEKDIDFQNFSWENGDKYAKKYQFEIYNATNDNLVLQKIVESNELKIYKSSFNNGMEGDIFYWQVKPLNTICSVVIADGIVEGDSSDKQYFKIERPESPKPWFWVKGAGVMSGGDIKNAVPAGNFISQTTSNKDNSWVVSGGEIDKGEGKYGQRRDWYGEGKDIIKTGQIKEFMEKLDKVGYDENKFELSFGDYTIDSDINKIIVFVDGNVTVEGQAGEVRTITGALYVTGDLVLDGANLEIIYDPSLFKSLPDKATKVIKNWRQF